MSWAADNSGPITGPSIQSSMAPNASINKATNVFVSRIIPLVLVGLVGYASWVEIKLLCGQGFRNHLAGPC